ncbi:MAG: hypothetical protein A3E93_00015 [Candidatus Zambryskibacteria bacterium RIFCSPHIGHO2_12_FULL_43_12b]|uniref:Uncharacterized protein n=1 Tax=Candidatus Zambryskibacteria bacterium RIFCSPLOWO2_01_FULL_43_17 TaxID=1802760 RepID=A0A1G2U5C3_9BACT|nr:MAG: hypothetical protein A3E93_00015 [Candidatus Zambryskibacteria bacterium RIFCSPHIGHO2_12_FULL_43_12b]OHB04686.1 MAG: hypothetical protein A2920_02055 [Candidatus Zambryskibacteria bacterium RIFCSPLOWO2_01_FULL_43_17]
MKKFALKYLPDLIIQLGVYLVAERFYQICNNLSSADLKVFVTECKVSSWTSILIVMFISIVVNICVRRFVIKK